MSPPWCHHTSDLSCTWPGIGVADWAVRARPAPQALQSLAQWGARCSGPRSPSDCLRGDGRSPVTAGEVEVGHEASCQAREVLQQLRGGGGGLTVSGCGSGRINPSAAAQSPAVSLLQPPHTLGDRGVRLGPRPQRASASPRGFRSLTWRAPWCGGLG